MKNRILQAGFITLFSSAVLSFNSSAQQDHQLHAANGMTVQSENYQWFTLPYKDISSEVMTANKGYEQNPEVGRLFAETPCDGCYEVLKERTEISKTFIKKGTDRRDIMRQTSNMPMHMLDAAGNWKTIKTHIEPDNDHTGVYAAYDQPIPVAINTADRYTTLGKAGKQIQFNHDLELIYQQPDGTERSLGAANWSAYTAGDDGVYVINAWPGVDIEMHTIRGAIKTNFVINHAMPEYADGKLLVRDHLQLDNGLSLSITGKAKHTGNIEVMSHTEGLLYAISMATAYEKGNAKATLQELEYGINDNILDIAVPGSFLNRASLSYPVIIDPLVSTATTTTVTGSTYSAAWTTGCVYSNAATVPANCTVTDIQWTFNYTTTGGAWLDNGAVDFKLGTCRSPGTAGYYWYCNLTGAGTCTGTGVSVFSDVSSCVPAPQCSSYDLNMTMNFYQNYHTSAACASTYVYGAIPLTITVFGHTVEINPVVVTGATTICAGQSTTLSTTATYGVPPYTFTWMPGSLTGSPVSVSPTATTTYTATVTDACGQTGTATRTITVNPLAPITGPATVCLGGTITLTDAAGAGTWSSSNPSVASITAGGVVSGLSIGTTTITFITPAGCTTTYAITVNTLSNSTGTTTLCVGANGTLSNATGGGTWTCAPASVATIDPATGVWTAVGAGTATVTYTTAAGCSTTINITVNPAPAAIAGPSGVCAGSSITLTDGSGAGSWSSNFPGTASVSSTGVVSGVIPGTVTITYTLATTCSTTVNITVNPVFNTSFAASICAGSSYSFGGNMYTATGSYPHTFTSVSGCDSTVTLNLTVNPFSFTTIYDSTCAGTTYAYAGHNYAAAGTYLDTFANINGCDSIVTLNLFIKPLPPAPSTNDVVYCQYATAVPLTGIGSNMLWYGASVGGVGSSTFIPSTLNAGMFTYYASQTVDGCEGPRAPASVTVHVHPVFAISPAKPYDCQGDTLTLSYAGPSFPGIIYSWGLPAYAAITSGSTSTTPVVVKFDTSYSHNFVTLTVGDGYTQCNATDTFDVPVYLTSPLATFYIPPTACVGDSVKVALVEVGAGINDYIWNFDGGNVVVASSNAGGPYKVVWNTAGTYTVALNALSSPFCPSLSTYDTIKVTDRPDGSIAGYALLDNKTSICIGDSAVLKVLHYDPINAYTWSPAHFFNQNNADSIYGKIELAGYVTLKTESPFGCVAYDSVLINAQACCNVVFPMAFSPNGDGHNDVFRPITPGNHKVHIFRIANRWGQTVFETTSEHGESWDGTFGGVPQDAGVYYYYYSYDCNNTQQTMHGDVTLVR